MTDIILSVPQSKFVTAELPRAAFVGGVGSGKTFTLALFAEMMRRQYPDCQGFIGANTYKQLKKATLAGVFKAWQEWGLIQGKHYHYHKTDHVISFPGQTGTILCGSLEEYDNWRGIEIGWFAGDEAAYYAEEAYDMFVGRLRDKRGPRIMRLFTTPKGFNWLYDRFDQDDEALVVNSATQENTSLPADYVKSMETQYDPEVYRQEVLGQFINLNTGAVYRMFDSALVSEAFDRTAGEAVYWGNDFNVTPMTAVAAVVRGDTIVIFDELFLQNATTFDMAAAMRDAYPDSTDAYPDASGNARKSSAVSTDHHILKDAGFRIHCKRSNPAIRDRWNCVNGLLHHRRVLIHPRCKRTIRDFQRLTHDNKDDMLGHISDAVGYLCWGLFPLRRRASFSEVL